MDQFDMMDLSGLCDWYIDHVGYDPIADNPELTEHAVRITCREIQQMEDMQKEQL